MSAHGHDPLDVEPGDVVRVTAAGCPDGWAVEIVERVPKPVVERAVEVIRHASGYHLDGHHIAQALADANLLWPRDEHDEIAGRVEALQARLELSPADFDVQTRGRAFEEALLVAGFTSLAAIIRVLTDMASGDCPLHGRHPVDVWSAATPEQLTSLREDPEVAALHERMAADSGERHDLDDVIAELGIDVSEEPGPPVDGREVDTPPDDEDHEHCPDCGCDPDDHESHADGCRRIGTSVHLQCGPPWNPWPTDEPLTPAQQIRRDEDTRSARDNPKEN